MQAEGKTLLEVTTEDLNQFRCILADRGLAVMSRDLILRHVRRLFRWLSETGRIFLDPAEFWSLPYPVRPLMSAPTEEQIATLLAQPDIRRPKGVRDRALIETAYSTGARLGELIGLKITDVDQDRGLLRVMGKGRKERMLPLGKQAVDWLRQYIEGARKTLARGREDEERLWLGTDDARPLTATAIQMMLLQYTKAAGLPRIGPHALRRACATHMLRNGAHPVQIQLLLGHVGVGSLSQYLRLSIQDIRAMHAAGKPGR